MGLRSVHFRTATATETISGDCFCATIRAETFCDRCLLRGLIQTCSATLAEVCTRWAVATAIWATSCLFFHFPASLFFSPDTLEGGFLVLGGLQACLGFLTVGEKKNQFSLQLRITFPSVRLIRLPSKAGECFLLLVGKLF